MDQDPTAQPASPRGCSGTIHPMVQPSGWEAQITEYPWDYQVLCGMPGGSSISILMQPLNLGKLLPSSSQDWCCHHHLPGAGRPIAGCDHRRRRGSACCLGS